jgi:hypothetical protein
MRNKLLSMACCLIIALGAVTPGAGALAADVKTLEQLRAIEIDILLARRDRVEEAIFAQEQALKRISGDSDIARRLWMLQDQLADLNEEITALRSAH